MAGTLFSSDILAQARSVGGEMNADFDRQTGTSERLPIYSVVGRGSKDSSYRGEMNGKSVEVSRAGEFRRKTDEGLVEYFESLDLVIIDARTCYTIFKDNKVVARGVSTKGMSNAVWTDCENGCVEVGTSCESSPFSRWVWEKQGGKEGKVYDNNGVVLAKEDLASCALQLWCWDISKDEFCIVQFSAGSIKSYRDEARDVESQGVKMHSLVWKLTTRAKDNGDNLAPSYVPSLEPLRVLTADEFTKADEQRATLVVKMAALAPAKQDALPLPKARALPLNSAFNAPPLINKEPAEFDPNDKFALVD